MALTFRGRPVRFSLAWLKPPPVALDGNMTLFEHLRELRYRLVVAALTMIVAMVGCAFFYNQLLAVLIHPFNLARAQLAITRPDLAIKMTISNVAGSLSLAIKVVALAAVLIASPVILYQLWAFIVPGLLAKEKKWALIFVGSAVPMFLAGVVLGYFVMPKGISVLLGFTPRGSDIENLIDTNTFLSFLMRLMLVFGLAFLIPVIVLMLNFLGVVKAKWLAKFRVYIIFGTCVFGAVATPSTDPFSMLALAVPMTVLFLVAEIIAHINDRRRAARVGGNLEDVDTVLAQLQAEDRAERDAKAAREPQRAKVVVARRPSAAPTAASVAAAVNGSVATIEQARPVDEQARPVDEQARTVDEPVDDLPAYQPDQPSDVSDDDGSAIDDFKSAIQSAAAPDDESSPDGEPARR